MFSFPAATVAASQSVNISVCTVKILGLRRARSGAAGDNASEKQRKCDRPRMAFVADTGRLDNSTQKSCRNAQTLGY